VITECGTIEKTQILLSHCWGKKIHFGGAQIIFLLTLRFREAVTSKRERDKEK
jgi:hypothetical protein